MTIKNYKTLKVEQDDGILFLSINREKQLNALNREVLVELKDFLSPFLRMPTTETPKGMLFSGAGEKAFIAGADIKEMSQMNHQEASDFGSLGQSVTMCLEDLPFPVIACVHGYALGGGMEMAMSCDFIYATGNAVFGQPELKLGLIPGFGGTQRLPRLVGLSLARELIYTGRELKASEALEVGLVRKLCANKEELFNMAKKSINQMNKVSPHALGWAKRAILKSEGVDPWASLADELEYFADLFSEGEKSDSREGMTAFLEKRPPKFTGN